MANPYFNATYYLQNNLDLIAAGINTVEGAWAHYVQFGAAEALQGAASRSPAPWFDIKYYLSQNADLVTAGLTAGQLFEHFINFGIEEGRQPSAEANVNSETLAAYAAANADLREAFGIEEGAELTPAQELALAQHFYAFGYAEPREGKPSEPVVNKGEIYTLTEDLNQFVGTSGDDIFQGFATNLKGFDSLDGGAGNDTLNLYADTEASTLASTVTVKNIETINLYSEGDDAPLTAINAARFEGANEIWQIGAGRADLTGLTDGQVAGFRDSGIVKSSNLGAANVTAADAATSISIALDNVGGTGDDAEFTTVVGGKNVTTLNISGDFETDGAKLGLATADATASKIDTINLAIDSDVELALYTDVATWFPKVTTIDASSSTGDLDMSGLVNLAEAELQLETINLGSGADTIVVATASFANDVAIDLGAGNDNIGVELTAPSDDKASALSITGGAGRDTFLFSGQNVSDLDGDDAQETLEANLVTITDFGNGKDILALDFEVSGFASQDVVDKFVENFLNDNEEAELVDLLVAFSEVTAEEAVKFDFGDDAYVFINTADGATVIQLAGVSNDVLTSSNVVFVGDA